MKTAFPSKNQENNQEAYFAELSSLYCKGLSDKCGRGVMELFDLDTGGEK